MPSGGAHLPHQLSHPLVVLDLNILVSGVLAARKGATSPTASCLSAARSGTMRLCLSGEMLARLRQVLQYPKLAFSEDAANAIAHEIAEWVLQGGKIVDTTRATGTMLLCDDPEDDRVLRTALLAGANYLVTGDADLLHRLTAAGTQAVKEAGLQVLTARSYTEAAGAGQQG